MNKKNEKKILQIIPALGFHSVYEVDGEEERSPAPLACWALVEEEGETFVVGMDHAEGDPMINFCEDMVNFVGYSHDSSRHRGEPRVSVVTTT